jgi:hypothetical protein
LRRSRQLHTHRSQHGAEGREALVDMAADEVLERGPAAQFECLGDRGPVGGLEVGPCGVGASARVGQGVAQRHAKPPDRTRVNRRYLECESVQFRRPVEGERISGSHGRRGEVAPRLLGLSRAAAVGAKHFGIGSARGLELQRQAAVVAPHRFRAQAGDHRLANPIVVDLDLLFRSGDPPDQPARPQQGQR